MKKTLLLIISAFIYLGAAAQSTKGTLQLGLGGMPIIYPNGSLVTGYSVRGNIGYFPINRLSVGLMPFAGKVEDMESIGANLYVRYYLLNKRFSLFAEGGGGIGSLRYGYAPQFNGAMRAFIIGPGFHYQFKSNSQNKLAIECMVQYGRLQNMRFPESTETGHTLIPTVGIQYFIQK